MSKKKPNETKQPKIVQITSAQNNTPAAYDPKTGDLLQPAKNQIIVFGLGADNKLYIWSHTQGEWLQNWLPEDAKDAFLKVMQQGTQRKIGGNDRKKKRR